MMNLAALRFPFSITSIFCLLLPAFTLSAQTLQIYHIDVEQADCTLFVAPGGATLLIDSGKNGHGSRIRQIMRQAGVNRIDHFVCTHYHEDHYGGIDELSADTSVVIGAVYDRGDKQFVPVAKRTGVRFREYEDSVGSRAQQLTRGETIALDPGVSVTCIASGGVVLSEEPPVPGVDENDMSISLLIRFGSFHYFIGGDIEHTTEAKIADRDLVLDVDVYQANHHGSHTSSSLPFLQDLQPAVVVISNGDHATFQHPRQATLDACAGLTPRPAVFQTNKYFKGGAGGNVADRFIADLEASDSDGAIIMEVNGQAGTYEVRYRDQSHTFQIKARAFAAGLVIAQLLPDPAGSDRMLESVTLSNSGSQTIDLSGCVLQDRSERVWSLASLGAIQPGESKTIQRNGMPMSLNNGGDEITLIAPDNQVIDRFSYRGCQEGVAIVTGH